MRLRSISQSLLAAMLMAVGLLLFVAVPTTRAANPLIQNVTIDVDPLVINIPGKILAGFEPKVVIEYDYNTGGYATGPVLEQILDSDDNVVFEFGNVGNDDRATGTYQLEWDGTYKNGGSNDGEYVPDGMYTVYLYSLTPSPPAAEFKEAFAVENAVVPTTALVEDPAPVYYTPSGDYDVNYSVEFNSAAGAEVNLTITGPLNNSPQDEVVSLLFVPPLVDDNYVIGWDGMINGNPASPGEYTYELQVEGKVNGYTLRSEPLTGQFTLTDQQNPQPSVSNVSASPNPYDPTDGAVTFSYELSNSLGYTMIYAQVYNSSDMNTTLKEWTFTSQGNGSNSFTWDGKNMSSQTVADGAYVLKVWGADGSYDVVPQQTSFTVETSESPEPPTSTGQCAGYSDVGDNDADCAAIEYVQSIGAMTGNPNGTFAPNEVLQRDQVAKISLETFGLFNDSSDYCAGTAAFPDVPSSAWSYQYICRGVDLGMITGYEAGDDAGFYRPARSVNRVEFLALILRNLSDTMPSNNTASYNDVPSGEWYSGYAKYAYDHSLFVGSNLQPTKFVTRREVAEALYELHNQGKI